MEPYWEVIKQIIKESDIVLEVLDARYVEFSRNETLENLIKEISRPVITIVNKSDLVPRKSLEISMDKLKFQGREEVISMSNKDPKAVENLKEQIKKVFSKYGKRPTLEPSKKKTTHKEARAGIVVGVLGYPNVGKSSIINAISSRKKVKVTSTPGTTHGSHWVASSKNIILIDTPGVIPLNYMNKTRLDLIGARSVEKISDKEAVAAKIIELFLKENKQKFEEHYNIKIEKEESAYDIIEKLGRKRLHLKKGGIVDKDRTHTLIIREWQKGELKLS